MSSMTTFRYVDFYDVPHTIVLRFQNRWFLRQSAFNDELDDYERSIPSIPCPTPSSRSRAGLPGNSSKNLS
jgi:hypothetical protein